jgi:signal transduction histidine kinase
MPIRRAADYFLETLREQQLIPFFVVFTAIFVGGKLGQYIFYTFNTSPALIWPPAGIALAAFVILGYRAWLPVLVGNVLIYATSPGGTPPVVLLAAIILYTLTPLVGAIVFNYYKFDGNMGRTRDALLIVALALSLTIIAPLIIVGIQLLTHTLTTSAWISWSRAWAGRVLSILVLTPFLTSWFNWRWSPLMRNRVAEAAIATLALLASVYVVFWTALPQLNVFLLLYLLLGMLFWVALRLGPRMTALAFLLMTIFGMAGSVLAHPTATPLNTQLFADELFIILLSPIFLILSALVEERRITSQQLSSTVDDLKEALHKLEIEDGSKNEFIATLAHELRNPLAPVVSTLEILKLEDPRPELLRLISSAEEQLQQMRRLLDDLLDVARITQRTFKLQKEQVSLDSAISRSVRTVEHFVGSQQQTLLVSLPKERLTVLGDPVRLTQIFTNILYNAAKYTPLGGTISIEAHRDGESAVVSVTDTGIGIEQSRLERIFEPFVHSSPRGQVGTGLGIGLSLTKRLVEMHEGEITAQSDGKGLGSTFTVHLPTHEAPPEPAPAAAVSPTRSVFKILVVDDNEAAAQALKRLLSKQGHDVSLVYTGTGALEAVSSLNPQVILLDIGLPDIDGYEVARQLRRAKGATPYIIALTGYGQDEDRAKAFSAGFHYHLTKPVGISDIEKILYTLASAA